MTPLNIQARNIGPLTRQIFELKIHLIQINTFAAEIKNNALLVFRCCTHALFTFVQLECSLTKQTDKNLSL